MERKRKVHPEVEFPERDDYMILTGETKWFPRPERHPRIPLTEATATVMRRYIPNAILPKLDSHSSHLAEIWQVSVVFINVRGIDLVADHNDDVSEVSVL